MAHHQIQVAALLLAACGSGDRASVPPLQILPMPPTVTHVESAIGTEAQATPDKPLPEAIARIQRDALHSSHAFEFVRSLTDDSGPRLTGSDGDKRAVAWALRTMKSLGLANVRTEKVMAPHWVRGVELADIVAPVAHQLKVTALGRSVATPAAGVTAEVIEVDSLEELKKLDHKLARGKIIFANMATKRTKDGHGYGEAVGMRWVWPSIAAKAGARALVLRSCGTDHDRLPHTGATSTEKPQIPAGALSVPDAEMLHRLLAERKVVTMHLTLTPKTLPDVETANVMGEIRGSEKPDEVVLIGAHLDSWDLGTGAIDDGAGVGIALETVRLIGLGAPPRRSVRVVLFGNEESGGAGGKAYARNIGAAGADRHVAAIEADLGGDRAFELQHLAGPEASAKLVPLAAYLLPLGVAMSQQAAGGGADLGPLRALGVPMIDVGQDGTHYFDIHHTANDTIDKIDASAIAQASAAFATVVYTIANLEGDLGRVPDAKRKSRW